MTWQGERFKGKIGLTIEDSIPAWPEAPAPPEGAPNIIYIVLDDVGFAHLGCYGSPIETPNMDRLAANGLLYNNFHTTGMCSPTRANLMTGRNHHTCGMGMISELAQGYPGYNGIIPQSCGFISQVLQEHGYANYALGKWHLCPTEATTMAGPFDNWPLGRGFERFYGFLGAETNQFHPDLVYDNHYVDPPKTAEEGYHLTEDLADKAISFIRDLRSVNPVKPFLMYFCTGATHAPHQAPREWIEKYRGKFDSGWDVYREETYRRQLELGVLPPGTDLSPRPDWVKSWDTLSTDERRLYARQMEIFAGFLSHTDYHIGRLIKALEALEELENTLIILVSDNGASGEGGYYGSFNEQVVFNGTPDTVEANLAHFDDLGGPNSFGHYATGWTMAGNTPFERWKRATHRGGTSDPCIVHWPKGISARGEVRHHYAHAIDVVPTILDVLGIEFPAMLHGIPQEELAGVSLRTTFASVDAPEVYRIQYYELSGNRALYRDGWKAVAFHGMVGIVTEGPSDPFAPYVEDKWELYHVTEDFSEVHDVAARYPEKLQELIEAWLAEAGKYKVFPLHSKHDKGLRPRPFSSRERYTYWPGTTRIDNEVAVDVKMRPFNVIAFANIPETWAEGILITQGGSFGGWSFFVKDGFLYYEHNYLGMEHYRVKSDRKLRPGPATLGMQFEVVGSFEIRPDITRMGIKGVKGRVTLFINGQSAGSGNIDRTVPFVWSLTGEGLCCGYDSETPVSDLYQPPFKFSGELDRVVITVDDKPFENAAKKVELEMMRQ